MHSMMGTSVNFSYGRMPYSPSVNPSEYSVLDLSMKSSQRVVTPDYTYTYPSPKSSPHSNQSHEECPQTSFLHQVDHSKQLLRSPTQFTFPVKREAMEEDIPITNHHLRRMPRDYTPPLVKEESDAVTQRGPISPCISEASETSLLSDGTESYSSSGSKRKIARPFKSLAKDSVALSVGAIEQLDSTYSTSSFTLDDIDLGPEETKRLMEESAKKYEEFREKMLMHLRNNNNNTNHNMRRIQNNEKLVHDMEYREKRRKNNEAAKKSRDARRNKQDEIAIRATFLEQENIMLKCKVNSEIEDLNRLRRMELTRNSQISSC